MNYSVRYKQVNSGYSEGTKTFKPGGRWRKLEILVFVGIDACGWVNKVKCYFQIKEVMVEEKLQAVMVTLEGMTLSWFQ